MGIKRCPSFSKRPGFPCGLRVLLVDADTTMRSKAESLLKECCYTVTTCSTTAEALTRLTTGSNCYDVLLADKAMVSGKTRDRQQLLDSCKGLPCILMALDPSPSDIMAGIQLGAVDFLAKPLSPLKLRNIWQHTVRKMMCNMNINCTSEAAPAAAAAAAAAAVERELDEMEVIMEEPEREAEQAEAEAVTNNATDASADQQQPQAAADANTRTSSSSRPPVNTMVNVALATMSSFYEPSRCPISRTGSSAATTEAFTAAGPGSPCRASAVAGGAAKQQRVSKHAPVHSCPSTRSLNSSSSCYSNLLLAVPPTPGSPSASIMQGASSDSAEAAATTPASPCPQQQQRCMKKAVRHSTPATPASKPHLGAIPKPQAQQNPAPLGPGAGATTAGPLPRIAGLTSVPLPTGLGPLPHGMVWGMPMCPLARAPGWIVPPTNTGTSSAAGSQQASNAAGSMMPMAWGMMPPMPGMPPFMPAFGLMPPMPPMPFGSYGAAPGMMAAGGFPGFDPAVAAAAAAQQQHVPAAPVAVLPACLTGKQQQPAMQEAPTGAALSAALNARLGGFGTAAGDAAAAATAAMDIGDAFDFSMLGDITAEDDLDVGMSGLLDRELAALENDGLNLPAELQELEVEQACQQQLNNQRTSFECSQHSSHQRVSFDCSTTSTGTANRVSFDSANTTAGMGAALSYGSHRVSFEVCCNTTRAQQAAAAAASPACPTGFEQAAVGKGCSDPAALLGSMSDLFASCSDDSCSLFDDVMDDLPLELAMKKSSSLADLLNGGGLTAMHA